MDLVENSAAKNLEYLKGKLQAFGLAVTETEKNYEDFQNITCANLVNLGVSIIKERMKNQVFKQLQQIHNIREVCLNGRVPNQVSDEEIANVCEKFMQPELCLKLGPKRLRAISKCKTGNLYVTMDSVLYESFLIFRNIINAKIYDVKAMPISIQNKDMILNLGNTETFVVSENEYFIGNQCYTENNIKICSPSSLYGASFNCLEEIYTNKTIKDCQYDEVNKNDCYMLNLKVGFQTIFRYARSVRQVGTPDR